MTVAPIAIVGGGHNALVTAFYLARAGHKPIVLERRHLPGGAAVTEEFAPGFRGPTLAHATGPMRASVLREMGLRVEFVRPETRLVAIAGDGRALALSADEARSVDAIRGFSAADAEQYASFSTTLRRLAEFLSALLESTPPSLDTPATGELWDLLKLGRRFRGLGRRMASGCCAGCRWRSPTSLPSISPPMSSRRPSRPEESSAPRKVHGLPERARCCC